jgi:hypothetical protein
MQSDIQIASLSKKSLWAGRIISGLIVGFLLFDNRVRPSTSAFLGGDWTVLTILEVHKLQNYY